VLLNKIITIPLSLYVHIPWCVRKCPYCDFNSHALNNALPEYEYIDALIADLKQDLHLAQGREIKTIFFGGGTPSLFSPKALGSFLEQAAQILSFAADIEITLEMNPGTSEYHNVADYRAAGITRISLGAQSFNDQKLQVLGRIHRASETINAIKKIKAANFKSFNIDLMHGLPQQSITEAIQDLQTALDFDPPHISWYQLTLEPNTVFYKYPPPLPNDEITWEIQLQGEEILRQAGMQHYEVSAFAKPDHQCQHNLNYWTFGDYLGIGAGAHSKITNLKDFSIQRSWKTRNPKDYLDPKQNFIAGTKILEPSEIPGEYMLNRLRLFNSINLNELTQRTGLPNNNITAILNNVHNKGLVRFNQDAFELTLLGRRFLNEVLVEMI
jgi:oxygen-independent coproporphyrinogen-3 oxidase